MPFSTSRGRMSLLGLVIVLPFLFAYTLGPATNMLPLLFGLGCTGVLLLLSPAGALRRGSNWVLLALPFVLQLHSLLIAPADTGLVAGAALALLAFWAVAQAAAGWQAQQKANWLWGAVLVAALLNSLICLLQYQGRVGVLSPWVHPGNPVRVFGNLRQPNQMATLSAMGFAILLLYAPRWTMNAQRHRSGLKTATALAALVLLAFACAATRSRTGLLQWLGVWGVACLWAWRGRAPKAVALWATVGLLLYGLWAWGLAHDWSASISGATTTTGQAIPIDALTRLENASQDARTVLWNNVWQATAQQPGLGWGWGNLGWGLLNTPLQGRVFAAPLDNAHNLPLHLAVELGWPLALLFCAAVGYWVWRRQPWQTATPQQQSAWLVLAAIGLHSLLEYPLWHAPFLLAAALAFGVLATATTPITRTCINRPRILGLLLLALSLAFTADWLRAAQVYLNPEQRLDFFSDHPDWFDKAHSSSWFSKYTEFAQLSTTELTADNAAQELARAQRLLHYSSEVRVLRCASDAAALLGNPSLAAHYQTLLKRRWPQAPRPQQPQPLPAQASDH